MLVSPLSRVSNQNQKSNKSAEKIDPGFRSEDFGCQIRKNVRKPVASSSHGPGSGKKSLFSEIAGGGTFNTLLEGLLTDKESSVNLDTQEAFYPNIRKEESTPGGSNLGTPDDLRAEIYDY